MGDLSKSDLRYHASEAKARQKSHVVIAWSVKITNELPES